MIITPDLASVIMEQVRRYLADDLQSLQAKQCTTASSSNDISAVNAQTNSPDTSETRRGENEDVQLRSRELEILKLAFEHKVLYIMGKEQMVTKSGTNILRKVLLNAFLWMRENTRNKMANLRVPADQVIEIGFLKKV